MLAWDDHLTPEEARIWADPCDWLPRLQARTDAILAALHAANAPADAVVIDNEPGIASLASERRDEMADYNPAEY